MAEADLNAGVLRARLSYNPETGIFCRLRYPKSVVGRIATKGYRQIMVKGTRAMAHRLAWLYVHGEWPQGQIDHINQCKDDNRICNLRVVSNKQNSENITLFKHNTSGHRGVRWNPHCGKWIAEIKHQKRSLHLGVFDNMQDAVTARIQAEGEVFTHAPVTQNITHAAVSL